ncbi:MAG: putative neuraminidase (sialidase), partial [Rhodoglobus sp.]|nr:putative neuraminidase (sialidase) [Rhodoglobus sp.]
WGRRAFATMTWGITGFAAAAPATDWEKPVPSEFIYESAPFPSCHASTIAETPEGLVASWFGGTAEKNPDVAIYTSRQENGKWLPPIEAANGLQPDGKPRLPCWNPVLFQAPQNGPLVLFYKVGPTPETWWGMRRTSAHHGKNWSAPTRLPDGMLGPIKNKPVQLPDGSLLCPSSSETESDPSLWRVHFEHTPDLGLTWTRSEPVNDGQSFAAIQPAILFPGGQELLALGRTRQGKIFRISSPDLGKTWGPMAATDLPNPNSGIDAVTLRDGRHLLIYNHARLGRSPLNLAISKDGTHWQAAAVLESAPGEYSYPAIIQARDGKVHLTWTWRRQRVKHAIIDPDKLSPRDFAAGAWPPAAK